MCMNISSSYHEGITYLLPLAYVLEITQMVR